MPRSPRKPAASARKRARNEASAPETKHQDEALDEALMETFPASDPIAVGFDAAIVHTRQTRQARRRH